MTYRSLDVWQIARDLSVGIHKMTLENLPKIELYEEGQQIRRSIKSVRSNIVEGYGRRRYKNDFIRFLTYAFASAIETIDHLECLHDTHSLQDQETYESLHGQLTELGRKLNRLIQAVETGHKSVREVFHQYNAISDENPVDPISKIKDPISNIKDPISNIKDPRSNTHDPASSIQHLALNSAPDPWDDGDV